jgi:hypothetical protein
MESILFSSRLTLPVMASINTRIGWPGLYWDAGLVTFAGYLVVSLLVLISLVLLFDQSTPTINPLALLLVTACILQILPAAESGWQFLPWFPWLYSGWTPVVLSVLTWLALGLAVLGVLGDASQKDPGIFIIMALVFNGLLSCWEIDSPTPISPAAATTKTIPAKTSVVTVPATNPQFETAEHGERIAGWNDRKSKLGTLLEKLDEDRLNLLRQLEQKGVKSLGEASADSRAKVLIDELRDVLIQQAMLQKKHEDYDLAILKSESRLRTIERRLAASDAGVNEPELKELTRSMITLNESLTTENQTEVPAELDTLLEQQLRTGPLGKGTSE